MTDTSKLEAAFEHWLRSRPSGYETPRLQFWLAWKAGAEWALDAIREQAGIPRTQPGDGK